MAEPSGQFIEIDGLPVHYRIEGQGPDLVVLHGASGSLLDWMAGPVDLLRTTNRVLVMDRPGLGHSARLPQNNSSLLAQARHLRKAADALGFERPVLAGHSYGGSVSLAWAVEAQDHLAGLAVIAAPSHEWEGSVSTLNDLTANPLTGPILSRLAPVLATPDRVEASVEAVFAPDAPPANYAELTDAKRVTNPRMFRDNALAVGALKRNLQDLIPLYDRLTLPMEILHGTKDISVPIDIHSERLAKAVPSARFTRLEGTGHMPHHARTDAIHAAVKRLNAAR